MENKITKKTAEQLMLNLFSEKPSSISLLEGNEFTKVYLAVLESGSSFIVKISNQVEKFNDFLKEQWCTIIAKSRKIPVREILEVGNKAIPYPYSIAKVVSTEAIPASKYKGNKQKLLNRIGKISAQINSITTEGFGKVFDWSANVLTKNQSMTDYLMKELKIKQILQFYKDKSILNNKQILFLNKVLKNIDTHKLQSSLTNNNINLKNVMVDSKGRIISINNWDKAEANLPIVELSKAMNSFTEEERKAFLKGYGVKEEQLNDFRREIDAFYIINKYESLKKAVEEKKTAEVDRLKKKFEKILNSYK